MYSFNEENIYSAGLKGPGSTLKLEPGNHAADFRVSNTGVSSLTFGWSDNDGSALADQFMVVLETNPTLAPADGNDYHNAHEQWVEYVNHGVGSVTFSGLGPNTEYTARIWPVSNVDWDPAYWDYKTGGTVPGISVVTAKGYSAHFEGEGETKTAYASGTVNLSGLDWDMTEALIGTDADDWKTGVRSARMRGYGISAMTMLGDKANGAGSVSFYYRRYGTDPQVDWKVEYSTDQGSSWIQIGSDFTAPESDAVQLFAEEINVGGNVRFRIKRATETGSSNARLNIDDISLTDYEAPSASVSHTLSTGDNVVQDFASTNVGLSFGNISNAASVTVNKFESAPVNIAFSGTAPLHHSGYRWVINAGDLAFTGGTIKIAVEGLSGIGDPDQVDIYKRSTPGSGSFEKLETTYTDGYLSAAITSFSEFIRGSDDIDTPLPISLASFTAEAANGKVIVSWVTESETENAAFRIYRDGELQTELEGAGTTAEPQSYSWTDNFVIPGKTYSYVLADVDLQGKETRHNEIKVEVEVEGIAQDYNIGSAYPNPFNPTTVVPVNLAKDAVVKAMLYDITGRPLQELQNGTLSAGSHALTVNGANLSTGIYFVRININEDLHVQKIALMK
jgi:hypothetical protein